jgi:hypothetical protein
MFGFIIAGAVVVIALVVVFGAPAVLAEIQKLRTAAETAAGHLATLASPATKQD